MSVPKNFIEVTKGFIQRGDYLIEKQPNSTCDEDIW